MRNRYWVIATVPYLLWAFCVDHPKTLCDKIYKVKLIVFAWRDLTVARLDSCRSSHVESGLRRGHLAYSYIRLLQQEYLCPVLPGVRARGSGGVSAFR